MQNIIFSGDNPSKILNQTKTLTARNWKRKPPRTGQLMTASTGRKKETRFAIIQVTGVYEWDGKITGESAMQATGLSQEEISRREGFDGWDAFIEAYYSINATKLLDDDRQDYFIGFKVETALAAR